jgi:hypothetical protein
MLMRDVISILVAYLTQNFSSEGWKSWGVGVVLVSDDGPTFCWTGDIGLRGRKTGLYVEMPGAAMMEAPISAVATAALPRWPAEMKARVVMMRASVEAVGEIQWRLRQRRVGALFHPSHLSAAPPCTAASLPFWYICQRRSGGRW